MGKELDMPLALKLNFRFQANKRDFAFVLISYNVGDCFTKYASYHYLEVFFLSIIILPIELSISFDLQ